MFEVSKLSNQKPRAARRRATVLAGIALAAAGLQAPAALAAAPDPVQRSVNGLVRDDGVPAALAAVTGRDGRSRDYTAGVGDLATGARVPRDGQVRIGSTTKAFTATVMLQLVGEGKVGLDQPVDTYLPGLLRGDGIDGRRITVRQLLQHTSGLPEYLTAIGNILADPHRFYEPRDLLDLALTRKADFAPGTKWEYSNTNYIVAGLLIEKVTGRPLGEEITTRIIDRLGLRHTYVPAPGELTLRGPHPEGYQREASDGPWRDVTELDPSVAWAAGELVSTNSDINHFFTALLSGKLLAPAELAQMRTTVPADKLGPGTRYGLGLMSQPLSCGGVFWGHGGDIPGYHTRGGVTDDGQAVSVTVTTIPDAATVQHVDTAVDTALCR
ncbi:D-alanyl-D-alanine carboxypeptidase [Kitasatospora sp. GP30]|uniref:serine hydrolase domain-containing protein n=1 Tax=Kitasatospora sp. GP30 TaxID=3035084 RepID=UPI000C7110A8|nr:serine hydrolase domain-containing protein [Kitasatospora sp. GP30]MDH6142821.1 D-alanyl-D-alanine carboxypeptidase [Kitasatospora sp. GP30]